MSPPVTAVPYTLLRWAYIGLKLDLQRTNSGMAHLSDVVFPFDALLELASQAVLVVHERMVQLQSGTAVLADSIPHLLHQHIMPCVSTLVPTT
jgi:hypothetical protein